MLCSKTYKHCVTNGILQWFVNWLLKGHGTKTFSFYIFTNYSLSVILFLFLDSLLIIEFIKFGHTSGEFPVEWNNLQEEGSKMGYREKCFSQME